MPGQPANAQSRRAPTQQGTPETDGVALPSRRAAIAAVCLAASSLIAALVAAVGPARDIRSVYRWPPENHPASRATGGFYAPLPLLNRVPGSIDARVSCTIARPGGRSGPLTVLATARHPQQADALRVVWSGSSLLIDVGGHEAARVPWPEACPLELQIRDGKLYVPPRTVKLTLPTLAHMPVVTGLFTDLALGARAPLRVTVRTRAYTTSPITRQIVAGGIAVALACAVLGLLAFPGRGSRGRSRPLLPLRRSLKSLWQAGESSDLVVIGTLLVWWIVGPTFSDDGWLWVEDRRFNDLGTITFYFDDWGIASPLGFWIEWLRHFALGSTQELIWLRLPTLFVLLASWALCRWCVRKVVAPEPDRLVRWTLAGAFLLGATAWGMTLRLEPVVALLTLCGLAAVLSFVSKPRFAPFTVAVPAAILSATAHPAGTVAAAPVLISLPSVARWLRPYGRRVIPLLGAFLAAALALTLVVFTLGADLRTRFDDARTVRADDLHSESWWHEYIRYTHFDGFGGGTGIRRLSLALLLLAALASLTRRRGSTTGVAVAPGHTVAVALVLLAFVPSKWPWHFGALAAVGAVAISAEVAGHVRASRRPPSWHLRQIVALLAVGTICLWAWWGPIARSPLELQTLSWRYGFNRYPWLVGVPALVGAVALYEVLRLVRARQRRETAASAWAVLWSVFATGLLLVWWRPGASLLHLSGSTWRDSFNARSWIAAVPPLVLVAAVASVRLGRRAAGLRSAMIVGWVIAGACFAFVATTTAVLIEDTARSDWSPARQNLETLSGRRGCGLADQLSGQPHLARTIAAGETTTLVIPSLALYFPCATTPEISGGVVQLPNYVVFERAPWPLEVKNGPFAAVADLYRTRKVAVGPQGVAVIAVDNALPGMNRADAVRVGRTASVSDGH